MNTDRSEIKELFLLLRNMYLTGKIHEPLLKLSTSCIVLAKEDGTQRLLL